MNDKSDGCKMVSDKKEKTGVFPGYDDISKTALQFGDRQDGWFGIRTYCVKYALKHL